MALLPLQMDELQSAQCLMVIMSGYNARSMPVPQAPYSGIHLESAWLFVNPCSQVGCCCLTSPNLPVIDSFALMVVLGQERDLVAARRAFLDRLRGAVTPELPIELDGGPSDPKHRSAALVAERAKLTERLAEIDAELKILATLES